MGEFNPFETPEEGGPGTPGADIPGIKFVPLGDTIPPICVPGTCVGGPGTGGNPGTTILREGREGNLGETYLDVNGLLLYKESLRDNIDYNEVFPYNHRFRGHREAGKFNYLIQAILVVCSDLFQTMRVPENNLETAETVTIYPTDAELATLQHVREQIKFKEWLLLKDDNVVWYE